MEYNDSLLEDSVPKALLKFAVPVFFGSLLQMLYTLADMWIVGRYATTADISAVNTSSSVMTAVTVLITSFASGASVLVGQYAGAKNDKDISRTVGTSCILFVIMSVIVSAFLLIFNNTIITLAKAPAEAITQTRAYLTICGIGIIFIGCYNLVCSILRGMGNSKAPSLFVAISSVLNVIGNYILIKIFKMGAAGAAISTVFSQAFSFVISLVYLKLKSNALVVEKADYRLDSVIVGKLFKLGGPIAIEGFLSSLSFVIIQAVINTKGLSQSAAGGIAERAQMVCFVVIMAMCTSVSAMSANNIGAGQPKRAKDCMWWGIGLCLIATIIWYIVCFTSGDKVMAWFTSDENVIKHGWAYMRCYYLDQVLLSFVFVMNGFFNSCGYAFFTMAHSVGTTIAVRMPLVFLLSKIGGSSFAIIGFASPAASFVSIVACLIFLRHIRNKDLKAV